MANYGVTDTTTARRNEPAFRRQSRLLQDAQNAGTTGMQEAPEMNTQSVPFGTGQSSFTTAGNPLTRQLWRQNAQKAANVGAYNLPEPQAPMIGANQPQQFEQEQNLLREQISKAGQASFLTSQQAIEESARKAGVHRGGTPFELQTREAEAIRLQSESQMAGGMLGLMEQQRTERMQGKELSTQVNMQENSLRETARQFDLTDERQRGEFVAALKEQAREFDMTDAQVRDIAYEQISEQSRQFNITTEDERTEFIANLQEMSRQFNMTDAQVRDIAYSQLEQQSREFDTTTEDGRAEFIANLQEMSRQFNLEDDRIRDIAVSELTETARQFNVTTSDGRAEYVANMQEMARQFNISDDQVRTIAEQNLIEQSRQFDITDDTQRAEFKANLYEQARQFDISDERIRTIEDAAIRENVRQFDITDSTQRAEFIANLQEQAREFNLTEERTRAIADAELTEQARQFDVTTVEGRSQFILTMQETANQFGITEERLRAIASAELSEQARQFNISTDEGKNQFVLNMQEMAREFNIENERVYQVTAASLTEQARQFDVNTQQGSEQYWSQLQWAVDNKLLDDDLARDLALDARLESSREFNLTLNADIEKFKTLTDLDAKQWGLEFDELVKYRTLALAANLQVQEMGFSMDALRSAADMLTGLSSEALTDKEITNVVNSILTISGLQNIDPQTINNVKDSASYTDFKNRNFNTSQRNAADAYLATVTDPTEKDYQKSIIIGQYASSYAPTSSVMEYGKRFITDFRGDAVVITNYDVNHLYNILDRALDDDLELSSSRFRGILNGLLAFANRSFDSNEHLEKATEVKNWLTEQNFFPQVYLDNYGLGKNGQPSGWPNVLNGENYWTYADYTG